MPNENTEKKDKIYVDFSNRQLFNRRNIQTSQGEKITLVSISLPMSAKHNGWYIDVDKKFVNVSRFNNNMSYTTFLNNQKVAIYKYDKSTQTKEKEYLTSNELQKEFSSWKQNKKQDAKEEEKNVSDNELDNDDLDDVEL